MRGRSAAPRAALIPGGREEAAGRCSELEIESPLVEARRRELIAELVQRPLRVLGNDVGDDADDAVRDVDVRLGDDVHRD